MENVYFDDYGNLIEEYDGWVFVNKVCVQEPGSDRDFDRYSTQVQNGDGYYNENGKFVRFGDC